MTLYNQTHITAMSKKTCQQQQVNFQYSETVTHSLMITVNDIS